MDKYVEYERLKNELRRKNLSPEEYERELKKLVQRLKI